MPNAYFVLAEGDTVTLDSDETKHLKVMRANPGDKLIGIDGRGTIYRFVLKELGKSSSSGKIIEREYIERDKKRVTIAVASTKWPRLRILIEKATELGVDRIEVFNSVRSVSRLDESKTAKLLTVAKEAAKQSVNPRVPEVSVLKSFALEGSRNLLLDFGGRAIREMQRDLAEERNLRVIVGPEGGFTQKEIAQLTDRCTSISLGSRTLRVETGVIVILSIINYFLGRI